MLRRKNYPPHRVKVNPGALSSVIWERKKYEPTYDDATLVAKATFLPPTIGGRKTFPLSGYRGQFFYNGMDCDAVHDFKAEEASFNEEVEDYIHLMNPAHKHHIHEGMLFLIREGFKTVGYGIVLEVRSPTKSPETTPE